MRIYTPLSLFENLFRRKFDRNWFLDNSCDLTNTINRLWLRRSGTLPVEGGLGAATPPLPRNGGVFFKFIRTFVSKFH